MERTHEELRSLVAPYVLGAVPPEDMAAIRAHILSCDECLAEADALSAAASSLALTVDPVPPPDGFSDRVLRRVDAPPRVEAAQPRRRTWWKLVEGVVLASLFATSIGLAVVLADVRSELSSTERVLSALVHSDDAIALTGPGAVGRVVPSGEGSILVAAGLPEAPQGHVYQWWLMRDGVPTSAGLFDVSDGLVVDESGRPFKSFNGAAVSLEPEGGSSQPTTDPIMSSS